MIRTATKRDETALNALVTVLSGELDRLAPGAWRERRSYASTAALMLEAYRGLFDNSERRFTGEVASWPVRLG
jgi:hypothetical protein